MTVFVSYSSRDRDAVKSLTQGLQDADEQVTGLGGQLFIQTAQLPRPTVAHGGPSSV